MSTEPTPARRPEDDEIKDRRLAAVHAAADTPEDKVDGLSPREAQDGTDWFMSPEPESEGYMDFELNVEHAPKQKWVRFRVGVMDPDRITAIRQQNIVTRTDPQTGREEQVLNSYAANKRIAAEGLINPDLSSVETRKVRGQTYADPADALEARFAHKPALIEHIAGYVIEVTGYNESDSREVRAGKS